MTEYSELATRKTTEHEFRFAKHGKQYVTHKRHLSFPNGWGHAHNFDEYLPAYEDFMKRK